jgi:hypothetical protein
MTTESLFLTPREQTDRLESATLALEAGSFLTSELLRGDDQAVLDRTRTIREWLLDGPGTHEDRLARRRAVRQLMRNMDSAAKASRTPVGRDVSRFLDSADEYYQVLRP